MKYVSCFTVEAKEVIENLNESRLTLEWFFADGRFPDRLWKKQFCGQTRISTLKALQFSSLRAV